MNSSQTEENIKDIIFQFLNPKKYKVFLFGSRASQTADKWSDFDIGILGDKAVSQNILAQIKEFLEESNIPFLVDVVDLSQVDDRFKELALKDAILWKANKKQLPA